MIKRLATQGIRSSNDITKLTMCSEHTLNIFNLQNPQGLWIQTSVAMLALAPFSSKYLTGENDLMTVFLRCHIQRRKPRLLSEKTIQNIKTILRIKVTFITAYSYIMYS